MNDASNNKKSAFPITAGISPVQAMQGGGLTGELIRNYDWSQTSLGNSENWPQSLQSALGICLNSNFPIAIYWGQDLTLLYNDAWSPIPGNKHPWALGKPAKDVWPDIWNDIEPQFRKAFSGVPGGSKDALLPMQRHGYTEECYFDFTFTPIYGESGKVDGIFNAVIETTYRVINERRAFLLQKLTDVINAVTSAQEVFLKTTEILDSATTDLSFFCIYLFDENNSLRLTTASKNFTGNSWPFNHTPASITHIEDLASLGISIPPTYWPEPPTEATVSPLKAADGTVFGYIAGGLSARRKYDKDYKSFFESLSAVVAGELNTIKALEEQTKRAEALAQIDKAKTIFFSNISHEFRTPLTLMLSPLESVLTSATNLEEQQRSNLEISLRNTLRLQKLVNTLLDFSRIEAGKMHAKFEHVDIGKLTKELASSFRSAIENAGITYDVQAENIRSKVAVDVDMWEKIVLNLISNAFKYTRKGKISVRISGSDSKIVLEVSDTGIGISPADREKIFERFYRVNNSDGRSQEGTGIGLSMVKELIALHQGEIKVDSVPDEGSVFTVTIPYHDHPEAAISNENNGTGEVSKANLAYVEEASKWNNNDSLEIINHQTSETRPKVLLADDNADMRDYVHRLLSQHFDVRNVANGEEAFAVARDWLPELILSDVMMPKLDGFGLLKKLKSNITTRNIPVVFLSARAGEEARVEGISAGADDYLVKPFSAKELLARVQNHILISRVRRETEKQFYNLFLQSPAHIHVMRGPDHVLEFFHPLGIPFVGGRDITGMKIKEALPELEGQGFFEMLDQVYHQGQSYFLPESKALFTRPDGTVDEYYFNITYLPWRNVDGKIQGVLQFTFDVTQQALSNAKVRESEERFRLLATSIPQIVWTTDVNGKMDYLSDQWEKFTGTPAADGLGNYLDFIHEADREKVTRALHESTESDRPWDLEFRLKNATGEYRWFSGHTLPLRDENGTVVKWIGSATDIHSQKSANEQLEGLVAERTLELRTLADELTKSNRELLRSNKDLQQFAHVTSHDLKEPIRKIRLYENLVRTTYKDTLPQKGLMYLDKIDHAANRMSSMIDGILQYSSVDAVKQSFEKINLNDLLIGITEDLEIPITEHNARVDIGPLPKVVGSHILLYQLFYNILNNSLKFIREKESPLIEITDKTGADGEEFSMYYRIDISDNGIGFEPAYAERIFESFIRLNPKDKFEGTGLGLALCKKVAERHNGFIKARSEVNEGATFSVYLPVIQKLLQ
ncbi:ATP-binding protein [Pollutibacter soli]|uniref:ATP-binding protein n=1 Tax=Pollutibacter soli TaxID=3034157 RepID=UPI0030136D6A